MFHAWGTGEGQEEVMQKRLATAHTTHAACEVASIGGGVDGVDSRDLWTLPLAHQTPLHAWHIPPLHILVDPTPRSPGRSWRRILHPLWVTGPVQVGTWPLQPAGSTWGQICLVVNVQFVDTSNMNDLDRNTRLGTGIQRGMG